MTASPQHVVLLGDSIFDNGVYVPNEPEVVNQLRETLPEGWQATLLALDGAMAEDVSRQLWQLPSDATHLVVSVGGNDALSQRQILLDVMSTAAAGMQQLARSQQVFRLAYCQMLDAVCQTNRPTLVCTVYDACPGLPPAAVTGLSVFNDIILAESFRRGLPVLDLRLVCECQEDYSALSPIEPSSKGGAKIAHAISQMLLEHDFAVSQSVIYPAA